MNDVFASISKSHISLASSKVPGWTSLTCFIVRVRPRSELNRSWASWLLSAPFWSVSIASNTEDEIDCSLLPSEPIKPFACWRKYDWMKVTSFISRWQVEMIFDEPTLLHFNDSKSIETPDLTSCSSWLTMDIIFTSTVTLPEEIGSNVISPIWWKPKIFLVRSVRPRYRTLLLLERKNPYWVCEEVTSSISAISPPTTVTSISKPSRLCKPSWMYTGKASFSSFFTVNFFLFSMASPNTMLPMFWIGNALK